MKVYLVRSEAYLSIKEIYINKHYLQKKNTIQFLNFVKIPGFLEVNGYHFTGIAEINLLFITQDN